MSSVSFKVFRLHFTSPLHISSRREDTSVSQKTIHSDTLNAALISCLEKVGKSVEHGELGCVISDLFPYYQQDESDEPTYFLPMPLQATLPSLRDPADAKKVKKVKWIDSRFYSRVLQGEGFFNGNDEDISLIKASYLTARKLPEDVGGSRDFIKSEAIQRVEIKDRTGKSPAIPYYIDRVTFKDFSGLYFLATGDTTLLEEAMQILEMEGVGTDRHVGYGYFKTLKTDKPLSLEIPEQAKHQVALSMFIPEDKEQLEKLLSDDNVAYDFTRIGGWITTSPYNTWRKNAIYAFLPGSVLCRTDDGLCRGRIADLKPDCKIGDKVVEHSIWRNGKAIMLPIQLKQQLS